MPRTADLLKPTAPHTKERCEQVKNAFSSNNHKENIPTEKSEMVKMHEENMVANRLLVQALNNLAKSIDNLAAKGVKA